MFPPIVYKYGRDLVDVLKSGRIKVTPPRFLNDALDCHPAFQFQTMCGVPDAPPEAHERALRRYAINFREINSMTFGFFCTSNNPLSHLMWSHYGDDHQGMALGFDTSMWVKNKQLFEVAYRDERPILQISFDPAQQREIGLKEACMTSTVKSKEWSHEQEYRSIYFLHTCERVENRDVNARERTLHFATIDTGLIKEVVLGAYASGDLYHKVVEAVEEAGISPTILRVSDDRTTYALSMQSA